MTRWMRLLLAALAVFGLVYLRLPLQEIVIQEIPTVSHSDNISPLSSFIFKVYLDRRAGLNRLRVLAINRCHKANESILSVSLNGSMLPLVPRPLEGSCPWGWAPGCRLGTYFHEVDIPVGENLKDVTLNGDVQSGEKSVHTIYNSIESGLTICIQPMYWYTDWTKLILFVEWWKTQNVSKFIFYHQSYSKEIQTVLDYYVEEGVAEVVSWSQLPSTEQYNPNEKVYRIGHTLAQNDCILRATTEYVIAVDVDELIVPKNGSLLDNLDKEFENKPALGSLKFTHSVLLFNPPLAPTPFTFNDLTYEGIKSTTMKKIGGPKKTAVRRDTVDRIATHRVVSFLDSKWREATSKKALLLHCRYNYVGAVTNHNETEISIIDEPEELQQRLVAVRDKIFPNGAIFNWDSQVELGKCLGSWRKTQNNCKSPATACREVMENREDWIEASSMPYLLV